MRKRAVLVGFVLLAAIALSAAVGFAADMFSGTWRMNLAKSTGSAATTNVTEIKSVANGLTLVGDSVNATGVKNHMEFSVQFDGKDYPYKQILDGKTITDSDDKVSAKKIDEYTIEITRKRLGAVLVVIKMVVSKDTRTLASTVSGEDQGQPFTSTVIFDKQ